MFYKKKLRTYTLTLDLFSNQYNYLLFSVRLLYLKYLNYSQYLSKIWMVINLRS